MLFANITICVIFGWAQRAGWRGPSGTLCARFIMNLVVALTPAFCGIGNKGLVCVPMPNHGPFHIYSVYYPLTLDTARRTPNPFPTCWNRAAINVPSCRHNAYFSRGRTGAISVVAVFCISPAVSGDTCITRSFTIGLCFHLSRLKPVSDEPASGHATPFNHSCRPQMTGVPPTSVGRHSARVLLTKQTLPILM